MKTSKRIYSTEEIGKRLQFIRKKKGYTQKQLADKMGYTQQYISLCEQGKTSTIPAILEFCDILEVDLACFDLRRPYP